VLSSVTLADSGSYSLNVGTEGGALSSNSMNLRVKADAIQLGDSFATSVASGGSTGSYRGSNVGSTASVWTSWTATDNGIVTFSTEGSTFDTTLVVYTGSTVDSLILRASDADSAGYLTSRLRFNAIKDTVYHVAIDGYNGASGDVALGWVLEVTDSALPVITEHPLSQTGVVGSQVKFDVSLELETGVSYAWLKEGKWIVGETSESLVLVDLKTTDAGAYSVKVISSDESVVSEVAHLTIISDKDAPEVEVNTKLDLDGIDNEESS
jgi:hypothetical protein